MTEVLRKRAVDEASARVLCSIVLFAVAALSCSAAAGPEADGGVSAASDLPIPPGTGAVPRPVGGRARLVVLPWAGFKSAVSYTFDDSKSSQIAHYADIAASGVRVTFYVTTSERWRPSYDATWSAAARAGDELGNHTENHCLHDLSNCPKSAGSVDAELDLCTSYISSHLNQREVWTMAYPYGDAGYEPAVTTRFFLARGVGGGMIAPSDSTDPFNLPTGGSDAIDLGHSEGKWLILLFHSLLPGDNEYGGVDIGSVTGSIEHAQSLGDVWIDTVANIGAYWLGQKLVEAGAAGSSWSWTLPAHFPPGRFLRVQVDGGTLTQAGRELAWDEHGYYEVALSAGELTWAP